MYIALFYSTNDKQAQLEFTDRAREQQQAWPWRRVLFERSRLRKARGSCMGAVEISVDSLYASVQTLVLVLAVVPLLVSSLGLVLLLSHRVAHQCQLVVDIR
jgi:hypothetical protein